MTKSTESHDSISVDSIVGPIFWLEMGKRIHEDSLKIARDQAKRLSTAVAWFWTAYTGLLVGNFLPISHSSPHRVLETAPVVLLLGAYLLSLYAASPLRVQFESRSPEDVQRIFYAIHRSRGTRLIWAQVVLAISVLCIAAQVITSVPKVK